MIEAANQVFTPELALKIGQAAGVLYRNGDGKVLIGKDTRLSGYVFEPALVTGFSSAGMGVLLTGPIPTRGVSLLVLSMRAELGIMISGGDKPFDQNRIRLFGKDGTPLSPEKEKEVGSLLGNDLSSRLASGKKIGRVKRIEGLQQRYIELLKKDIPKGLEFDGLRVAIDCANGAAYQLAPLVLQEMGAEVYAIGIAPDGTNINADCGVGNPKELAQKVREVRADLGVILDGSGEQVVLVDEYAHLIEPVRIGDDLRSTDTKVGDGLLLALRVLARMVERKQKASQVLPPADAA